MMVNGSSEKLLYKYFLRAYSDDVRNHVIRRYLF